MGSYEIKGAGAETRLVAVEEDPSPAEIGRGWLDAMLYTDTSIAGPVIRCGWLDSRAKKRSRIAGFVEVPWDEA